MLSHHRLPNGATVVEGLLHDKPFKAGCAPSTRSYIVGVELMARADLGLREDVNIIVMHRTLKRALDKVAANLFAEVTDPCAPPTDRCPKKSPGCPCTAMPAGQGLRPISGRGIVCSPMRQKLPVNGWMKTRSSG